MVKQRLFLGSIAFGISFSLSFLTGRDLGKAIAAGVTTTVAAVAAAVVVDRQSHQQAYSRIADLKNHIQALQQRRAQAYQAYIQLENDKEQLAANLQTLAFQSGQLHLLSQPRLMGQPQPIEQTQLTGSPLPRMLPASRKGLSWDLSAPAIPDESITVRPYELPTEIPASGRPPWGQSSSELNQERLTEATAAKRNIETSLAALQAELSQIKGQITDHRQTREKLSRDVANVREEKRQLEATAKTLKGEVQALETCRVELEQFLSYAEAKKRELETGANPLQETLKQLQTQVSSLQEELRLLDAQILDRRTQKEALEQQLALLGVAPLASKAPVQSELKSKNGGAQNGSNSVMNADTIAKKTIGYQGGSPKQAIATANPSLRATASQAGMAAVLPEPIAPEKPSSDLPSEWTEFMVQLPEYELQALKVIVEQNNPAAALKHIAEENLTMPELLIDSINERALETVGDLLIDASSGSGSAAIVREHLKVVKKLLKTYEYLVN